MYNYEEIYQTMKKAAKFALIKTIPIFLGYIFLGIAFGLLLQKSGLHDQLRHDLPRLPGGVFCTG